MKLQGENINKVNEAGEVGQPGMAWWHAALNSTSCRTDWWTTRQVCRQIQVQNTGNEHKLKDKVT